MRRENLARALANVAQALKESNAVDVFTYLTARGNKTEEPHSTGFLRAALTGYARFMVVAEGFGEDERRVLDEFGLTDLLESNNWLTPSKSSPRKAQPQCANKILCWNSHSIFQFAGKRGKQQGSNRSDRRQKQR
jgi:hypothetical protein